ncbi:MAG TPA: DUF3151 family protein [Acidimicrobiales bacterium]|nr:DUF3151 family protein [Acidimicrobiales bacterium]
MADNPPVNLSSGPPETVLPERSPEQVASLLQALGSPEDERRAAVAAVVASDPTYLDGWAALAGLARDDVEAYAYARVGYHRGLDALRAAGWKGSGYVRWTHESNRGFLSALDALRAAAESIGEEPEAQRCSLFLRQLDPEWSSSDR